MKIATERLVLREFREADWPDLLAYWTDPRYQRFYPEVEQPEPAVRALVGRFVAAQAERPRRVWQLAIVKRADSRPIGNCGIRVNAPARREATPAAQREATPAAQREASIGYELNPQEWGQGYATEAARAILRFGFDDLGLHRVWAECVADNTASARVLERLGLRREAHFHEHQWYKGRWWDTLIYAILDHEWRRAREEAGTSSAQGRRSTST